MMKQSSLEFTWTDFHKTGIPVANQLNLAQIKLQCEYLRNLNVFVVLRAVLNLA